MSDMIHIVASAMRCHETQHDQMGINAILVWQAMLDASLNERAPT